ncbi:hypothetical protein PM082_016204 [Marasmius tenuissimus]|nr:hypothetical protein PM082_016204 [Marasmius tenuissimus]
MDSTMDSFLTDKWTSATQDILSYLQPDLSLNTVEETTMVMIKTLLTENHDSKVLWNRLLIARPSGELGHEKEGAIGTQWEMVVANTAVQISLSQWNRSHTLDLERCWAGCEEDLSTTVAFWQHTNLWLMTLVLMIGYTRWQRFEPHASCPLISKAMTERTSKEFMEMDAVHKFSSEVQV